MVTAVGRPVLVVDNFDSFVYNLVQYLGQLGAECTVRRNDEVDLDELDAADGVLISPGPGTPERAGASVDVIRRSADRGLPVLGVCLGHQAIGVALGGAVIRAPLPMHGKVSQVEHRGETVFRGINGPIRATRYHSLVVERKTCPAELAITAETRDGQIMGLSHRTLPVHGVQFHPESILSDHGATIMRNFFAIAAAWKERDKSAAAVH